MKKRSEISQVENPGLTPCFSPVTQSCLRQRNVQCLLLPLETVPSVSSSRFAKLSSYQSRGASVLASSAFLTLHDT